MLGLMCKAIQTTDRANDTMHLIQPKVSTLE